MENFLQFDNQVIQNRIGIFDSVQSYRCYPEGELEGIRLGAKNTIITRAGELIPFYTETARRKNKYSVEFYRNGMIKSAALEMQQPIHTAIGKVPAELVTFYDSGELKRFFPLDGKISGFWTEEDEKSLQVPLPFDLGFVSFKAMINGVGFWRNGNIRSITLFSGELVNVKTSVGEIAVRNGFALHPSGQLASLEPAAPTFVHTPIGQLTAFDPDAVGITADRNSLVFDPSGRVTQLTSTENILNVRTEDGQLKTIEPKRVVSLLDGETMVRKGLVIHFDYDQDRVSISDGADREQFSLTQSKITVERIADPYWSCLPAQCTSCSMLSLCLKDPLK